MKKQIAKNIEVLTKRFNDVVEAVKILDVEEKKINDSLKIALSTFRKQSQSGMLSKDDKNMSSYEVEVKAVEELLSNTDKKINIVTDLLEAIKKNDLCKNLEKVAPATTSKVEILLAKNLSKKEIYTTQKKLLVKPISSVVIEVSNDDEETVDAELNFDGMQFNTKFDLDKYIEFKDKYQKYLLLNLEGQPVVSQIVKKGNLITYLHQKFHNFKDWNCDDFFFIKEGKKTRKIMMAQHWLETKSLRVKYESTTFEPDPEFNDENTYNFWKGFVEQIKGDVSRFYNHIANIVQATPEQQLHLIKQMAYSVRFPHKNFGVVPAFRGPQGCGKTTITKTFMAICPNHTLMTSNLKKFLDGFNGETVYIKYVLGEEALWGGDKVLEGKFKHAVTGDTREIEIKGITKFYIPNYTQFFLTSNEDWIMPADKDDRRGEVFDCSAEKLGTLEEREQYFKEYNEWLEGEGKHALVYHFMNEIDLEGFNPRKLVETSAKLDVKLNSLGHVEKFIYNILSGDVSDGDLDKWADVEFNYRRADLFSIFQDNTRSKVDQRTFSATLKEIFVFPDNWKDNWKNSSKGAFYRLGTLHEARLKFAKYIKADCKELFGTDEAVDLTPEANTKVESKPVLTPSVKQVIIEDDNPFASDNVKPKQAFETKKTSPTLGFNLKRA